MPRLCAVSAVNGPCRVRGLSSAAQAAELLANNTLRPAGQAARWPSIRSNICVPGSPESSILPPPAKLSAARSSRLRTIRATPAGNEGGSTASKSSFRRRAFGRPSAKARNSETSIGPLSPVQAARSRRRRWPISVLASSMTESASVAAPASSRASSTMPANAPSGPARSWQKRAQTSSASRVGLLCLSST